MEAHRNRLLVCLTAMSLACCPALAQEEATATVLPTVETATMVSENPDDIVHIGTASAGGIYYPAGGALCRLMNRTRSEHHLRCIADPSEGSLANLRALAKGDLDFAVVQSNWQYQAVKGLGVFTNGPHTDLRSVFSLYTEAFTAVVRDDSAFKNFEDIRKATVNLGPEGTPVRMMSEEIMSLLGWDIEEFAGIGRYTMEEQAKALCDGDIDVIFFTVGHPNGALRQALGTCALRMLPMEETTTRKIAARAPYLFATNIPAGLYGPQAPEVRTVGVKATLVTQASVPDKVVEAMVRSVFANFTTFKTLHPVFARLNPADMVQKGLTAPLHPAAERYYREAGLLK